MNEEVKTPRLSHEQKNLITSVCFCVFGGIGGYMAGRSFISEYIVPTIGAIEQMAFILFWVTVGIVAGWHLSKVAWCTCGI